jgi:queuine tRNA-ribosyltransferase
LVKSLEYHKKLNKGKKLFFGIVQGGSFIDLRQESLKFVIDQNPDGIAFGGETIGYNMKESNRLLDKLIPNCPENKPRYTMGLGAKPQDIVEAMIHGVDMFDCVSPARVARHGELFVGNLNFTNFKIKSNEKNNIIRIANSKYKNDKKPIDKNCQCPVCQQYSRAYLRYLFLQKEPLFMRLASLHNIYFMNDIINQMKKYIKYE